MQRRVMDIPQLYEAGHVATVVAHASAALRERPDATPIRYYLAAALRDLARYDESISVYEALLEHEPEPRRGNILAQIGLVYEQRGKWDLAESYYRKAVASDPDDAALRIFLGALLAGLGRGQEAEATHKAATSCTTGPVDEAWYNHGLVQRGLGRLDEAAVSFRHALDLSPHYPEASVALTDVTAASRG